MSVHELDGALGTVFGNWQHASNEFAGHSSIDPRLTDPQASDVC